MNASPQPQDRATRELIHTEGFLVEYLRDLQKRLCCLEDIAVIDDEITMFMEMRSGT